jgi:GT2 family glycosyltransferase
MDSDNPPMASRGRNPLELAELDKDVVVLPTPIFHGGWKNPFLFNCYDVADDGDGYVEHHPQEGLQEVDVGGSGCMLIARRVLEALAPIPFRCGNDENGIQIYGEDFMFCEKAREKGFSIWSHFDYVCHHYKEVDLLDYHVSAHRQSEADSEVEATV